MIKVKVGTTSSIDISRFVVDCDDIPVIARNRDYSAIGENIKLSLHDDIRNEDITTSSLVYEPNMSYSVYRNATHIYTGKVTSVEYKYGLNKTEIELEHPITSMKSIEFNTNEMASYLAPLIQSYNIGGIHNVNMLRIPEFIQGCFNRIGFTVDTSSYDTSVRLRKLLSGPTASVDYGHDMISYDMIWGINQTYIASSSYYNSDLDAINNRIFLYDVVNAMSNVFRFGYQFTNYNTVKLLVNSDETITYNYKYIVGTDIAYSNMLGYKKQDIPKYEFEPLGVKYDYYIPPTTYSPTMTDLIFLFQQSPSAVSQEHKHNDIILVNSSRYRQVNWYNNMFFYWFGKIDEGNYVTSSISTGWIATPDRYSGAETTFLDNNINQYEEIIVKDFDLTVDLKPITEITVIPTEIPDGELIKITQYNIDI